LSEPFDTCWQGTRDLERGYRQFATYYKTNYIPRLPTDRAARVAVLSCGPGYLVNTLVAAGYRHVVGVDADPARVRHARDRGLPCEVASAFPFLEARPGAFDAIVPEQELNHLTIEETIEFLRLCGRALRPGGRILVYATNGANPLVAPEHVAHNIDHLYNVTEHSLRQLLTLGGFTDVEPFPCRLYVFWHRPENYLGWAVTQATEALFRLVYRLYGQKVRILPKRIAATAVRADHGGAPQGYPAPALPRGAAPASTAARPSAT
jgi:SAM-dependent methyltransferase